MESLFYIVLSVVFFAFFTGLEISFLSATRWSEDTEDLEKQASNRLTRYFRHHSRQFLSTLLLGSALSLVVYVFLSYAVFRDLLWTVSLSPVWCSFLCALILSLVLGVCGWGFSCDVHSCGFGLFLVLSILPSFGHVILIYIKGKGCERIRNDGFCFGKD